jgi:hypothetical protein
MRQRFQQLKERIKKTKSELGALGTFGHDYMMKKTTIGVEQHVMFDINIMFLRHDYHTSRFLYHADRFIEILENYVSQGNGENQNQESIFTTWNDDRLYYEFDAFISTSASIFEEPFRKDAQECFEASLYKQFDKIFPNKSTPESLLWRLTIIRNRVVHPDHATFNEGGDRFMEFASKAGNAVEIKSGFPIRINGHLIDIANSSELKEILKQEVIERTKEIKKEFKKCDCKIECLPNLPDFHQIVFMKSKARNKKTKMIVSSGINLIQSFLSVTNEMIDYLTQLHRLFSLSYRDHLGIDFPTERIFFTNHEGKVYGWGKMTNESIDKEFKQQTELFGTM